MCFMCRCIYKKFQSEISRFHNSLLLSHSTAVVVFIILFLLFIIFLEILLSKDFTKPRRNILDHRNRIQQCTFQVFLHPGEDKCLWERYRAAVMTLKILPKRQWWRCIVLVNNPKEFATPQFAIFLMTVPTDRYNINSNNFIQKN